MDEPLDWDSFIFPPVDPYYYFDNYPDRLAALHKFIPGGVDPESIFTTLPRQFNTITIPLQDEDAFFLDVIDVGRMSDDGDDFFRRLRERREERLKELHVLWKEALDDFRTFKKYRANKDWQFFCDVGKIRSQKSFDSYVAYFASLMLQSKDINIFRQPATSRPTAAGAAARSHEQGARSPPSAHSSSEGGDPASQEAWPPYESTDEKWHPRDERGNPASQEAWPPYESTDEECHLRDEGGSERSGSPPRSESPPSRYATPPEYRTSSPAPTDTLYPPARQARDGGEKSWERADIPVAGKKKARTAASRPSPGRVQKKLRKKKKQNPARDPDRARPAASSSLQQTRHERALDKMLQGLGDNERIESQPLIRPRDRDGQLSPSPPSPSALQHKQQQQQQQPKSGSRHRAGQPPQPACTALDGVRGAKIAKARRKRGLRGPEASAQLLSAAQQALSGLKPPVPPSNALSTASVRRSRRLEEKAQGRAAAGLGARDR